MANLFSLLISHIKTIFSKRQTKYRSTYWGRRLKTLSAKKEALSLKPKPNRTMLGGERFTIFTKPFITSTIQTFEFNETAKLPVSMTLLSRKRIEEERKRIAALEKNISSQLDRISSYIKNRNVQYAEVHLNKVCGGINSISNELIRNRYFECLRSLSNLKEEIRQDEIKRKKEEERKRKEEERRKREAEEKRRREEEEKRLEKERKARELEDRIAREERERQQESQRLKDLASVKSTDAEEILTYLRDKGVHYFYHFTDRRNIDMIKKYGGLYSWDYSINHNIPVKDYGGDEQSRGLDARHGLQDYVRLSFCDDHPMAYRKHLEGHVLVLLMIKIDVAALKDTLFSNTNAAANDHYHGLGLSALKRVNIQATKQHYVGRENPIFHEHQAECMIKTFIPKEYILNLDNPIIMDF